MDKKRRKQSSLRLSALHVSPLTVKNGELTLIIELENKSRHVVTHVSGRMILEADAGDNGC